MVDYKLFSRERQGRRGGEAALYVREYFDFPELDDDDDRVGRLWVRIREMASKASAMVEQSRSVTDQPARRKRQSKFNVSSWKKSHNQHAVVL